MDSAHPPPEPQSHARAIPCDTCPVRVTSVCSVLPRHQRAILAQQSHVRHIRKGGIIAHEGDCLTQVSSITSGVAKMTKTLSDGRQQIVGLSFPSDVVGRPFAESSGVRVEAATDVTMCSFRRPQFEGFLREHPDLQKFLLKAKLDELDAARDWMLALGQKTAMERVATLLVMLAGRAHREIAGDGPQTGTLTFELPLSRSEFADCVGLRLETVSRQFSKLKKLGIIVTEDGRSLTILDFDRLTALAGL
jgi:CRP/FNR family transcriptional regulator, anaerobic regulatory protein